MKLAGFFGEVDPARCGGKGKNLIALIENRFEVPPGFVVTVDAYSLFRSTGEMPESVRAAVSECYRRLTQQTGAESVAIRSSASSEDSAAASFAGLHDSFLDIEGENDVAGHVVECWRSLHSERAVLYRRMMQLEEENQAMAVVVQTMVAARAAGVVFTANPYTMSETELIVESSWGRGDKVVSGQVTPDYFEIRKNDSFDITQKMLGSTPAGNGKSADSKRCADGNQPRPMYSISDQHLKKLCALAGQIESALGGPQDIEWALQDNGSFSILQSRPLARFEQR